MVDYPFEKTATEVARTVADKPAGGAILIGLAVSLFVTVGYSITIGGASSLASFSNSMHVGRNGEATFAVLLTSLATGILCAFLYDLPASISKERLKSLDDREKTLALRELELQRNSNRDILSPFREKLVGYWDILFKGWEYDPEGRPVRHDVHVDGHLFLDERTQKLSLEFEVGESKYFFSSKIFVEAIGIWPVSNPEHLDFFYKVERIRKFGATAVHSNVFSHTRIVFEGGEPTSTTGMWYDLQGGFGDAMQEIESDTRGSKLPKLPRHGEISMTKRGVLTAPVSLLGSSSGGG